MTRLRIVYTLNPGVDERDAFEQLKKTGGICPRGLSCR